MSKTIEFVEKEIKNIKELLELDDVLCLSTDEDYKFWYNRLQTLEQIKIELEAWKITKENTMGDDFHYEINIYKSDKGYNKFKKGLEVEDE